MHIQKQELWGSFHLSMYSMLQKFPCCLPNGTGYVNFLVPMMQLVPISSYNYIRMVCFILMELAVAHCLSTDSGALQSPQQIQSMSFLAIDIYAKLVYSILKGSSKLLLSKVLPVTVRFIQKDAEEKKASFNPRPFFRLFINWLLDLGSLEPVTDGFDCFCLAIHALQPLKVPAFSFSWLELISYRSFMPKMLTGNGQKGWPYIQRCL